MKILANHESIISKSIFVLIILFLLPKANILAIDYYQRQSGNWNNPNTWTTVTSWPHTANTGTYPQAGDNVHMANNGMIATITLTEDAECANLYFDGSEPACIIAMGDYNLTVSGNLTTNWSSNITITQGSGYLQINGGIPQFYTAKSIANFRVGSNTFYFNQTNTITLTVTSNYDYNCYVSSVPTGINATSATKLNSSPCSPSLTASPLTSFGDVCPNTTVGPNSFTISGIALTTANISVAALTGYSYSTTSGGTYTNTLSLTQSGGHYSQVIYVKFTPTATASYDGNIVVSGGGASSINVAAVGSGENAVTPTVTSPTSTNVTSNSATLGGNVIIEGCTSNSITERGIYYSTTDGFADGSGTKVWETGTFGTGTFSLNVSGLSPNTTYYYKAFATNSNGTGYSEQGTFNNNPKTYYSIGTGNWTSPSTWITDNCGGSINTGSFPQSYDHVVICQSHNITVNESGLSCANMNMEAYLSRLILNYNFTINGNLSVANQSYVSAGVHNLTISGNFSNTSAPYNSRIDHSTGNIIIEGDITIEKNGIEPFNCSSTGWLIMTGTSKTFTVNNATANVPRFKQPILGFAKAGNNNLTITNVFDQNCGPVAPSGVTISIPGNTINNNCSNTITTGTISGSPFCAGTTGINVPFIYTPSSNYASATFTAQLSAANGQFTSPTELQNVASNGSGSQSININIPAGTPAGTGYRIRVVSNVPDVEGSDNGTNLIINPLPATPGTITGSSTVNFNDTGIAYSVPTMSNASSYTWSYSGTGATINGSGNSITIDFSGSASSGDLTVFGTNSCGDGPVSAPFQISVNPACNLSASITSDFDDACPELIPAQGFNPENGSYDAGATKVIFTITRSGSIADWSFNYTIDETGFVEVRPDDPGPESPFPASSSSLVTVSGDSTELEFFINNVPGNPLEVTIYITDFEDEDGCTVPDDDLSVTIQAMPEVGSFN